MAEKTSGTSLSQPELDSRVTSLKQLREALLRGKLDSAARLQEALELIIPALEEARHVGITVTLPADQWNNRTQTIHDDSLIANSNYRYIVCGDADNFMECSDAGIRAKNITTDGEIVFRCEITPEDDLVVNIIRLEVETTDEQ